MRARKTRSWLRRTRAGRRYLGLRRFLRRRITGPNARPRDRGVALLVVLAWLAMMIALVGELAYDGTVAAAQSANARDEIRAHYLARSAVNLSRLLIKIQQRFIEPTMSQTQKMLSQLTGGDKSGASSSMGSFGFSIRVTDYADLLMGFFGGSKEDAASLGGLVGIDTSQIKGIGVKGGDLQAEITAEDGKIDINCGGGFSVEQPKQRIVYRLLMGLSASTRYDRLFSESDATGQFFTRMDVARAIIDWADADEQMFSPEASGGSEDYRYDSQKDRYKAHDNRYDTVEEVKLARGVTEGYLEAFQPYLTVYPADPSQSCRVNLGAISNKVGGDCAPILMGVLRAAGMADPAKGNVSDPLLLDDTRLYPLASILCERASAAGFDSMDTVKNAIKKPESLVLTDDPRYRLLQGMKPLDIPPAELDKVAYVGPPRVYKIVATGTSGRVKKKITAIVDTRRFLDNPLTMNPQSEQAAGVLQYWREE